MIRTLLVCSFLVAAASLARADQCQSVDADHASWATKLVTKGSTIVTFCESCGDKTPGKAIVVTSVSSKNSKVAGKKTVTINGKDVDLAYTYLQTGKASFSNVGMMVGCPVANATPIVTKQAEAVVDNTPTGVPECDAYFASFEQLSKCDAFPKSALDAMRDGLATTRKAIKDAPASARAGMSEGCKAGHDALREAGKSLKCPIN